ncbi:hypothetical protein [Marinibactrum halimedae]|uniref:Uncharacterized protein n=1 Tax=Marinibactrum halimedae TaxID=1444977 RepID=A0AA37T3P3_9GAMM|nr:hypothetical protein [Marinibactrum halimedae]MCD9458448.1 hypothetical protein [Marinibactrum halimedae]GLS26145.1 hypothetical protein GCM10007877_18600 [Marinibactrum halimedae]
MKQTKWESILEISMNYLSGFLISYFVYRLIVMPNEWLNSSALLVTILFTIMSVFRSYIWRRFFNAGVHKLIYQFSKTIKEKSEKTT